MVRQQSATKSFLPTLTRREKEVLNLITQGMSDMHIASQLGVSPSTIESHRKNLRSKLGARNSAEIVRIAMERGLMD
jgi:DNA-binding NarL/FixJ family response regulator